MNTLIYNFVWYKKERICRNTLIGKVENGGVNMPDIETMVMAAKAAWINRIFDTNNISSAVINAYLKEYHIDVNVLLKCHFTTKNEISKIIPDFYQEVFISYNKCQLRKDITNISSFEYLSQIIWYNNLFKYKNKCLLYSNWIKSGIIYVKDLFDKEGRFLSEDKIFNKLKVKRNWIAEYFTVKMLYIR